MEKKFLLFVYLLCLGSPLFAQINRADSTVQVISFWDLGESQDYKISKEKIKIVDGDTTARQKYSYDVKVSVIDSTENSYTIKWEYGVPTMSGYDPLMEKIMEVSSPDVIYTISSVGDFQGVVNWEEMRKAILEVSDLLLKELSDTPEIGNMLKSTLANFSSKEAIEASCIKEIQQYHFFHGVVYKLGEVLEGVQKAPNIYGGAPFDLYTSAYLDEIDEEDEDYIMRAEQIVNRDQLIDAVLEYVSKMIAGQVGTAPKRSDLKDMKNETYTASRIHESGWVIYSVRTTSVYIDNTMSIEETIIDLL